MVVETENTYFFLEKISTNSVGNILSEVMKFDGPLLVKESSSQYK